MKVTLNPVFQSLSGRIGDLVYYRSYGRQYTRSYVVPKNPDTAAQRLERARFADAVKAWQKLPDIHKQIIRMRAKPVGRTGYNLFISIYLEGDNTADSLLRRYANKAAPLPPVFSFSQTIGCRYERRNSRTDANIPPGAVLMNQSGGMMAAVS